MQNAVVLLYLAGGSFVACFLGEYDSGFDFDQLIYIFIFHDAKA